MARRIGALFSSGTLCGDIALLWNSRFCTPD